MCAACCEHRGCRTVCAPPTPSQPHGGTVCLGHSRRAHSPKKAGITHLMPGDGDSMNEASAYDEGEPSLACGGVPDPPGVSPIWGRAPATNSNRELGADPSSACHAPARPVREMASGGKAITPAELSELSGRAPAQIESLDLVGMGLSDVSALACCHGLRKLRLDSNALEALAGVEELPELQALSAQHNALAALDGLRGLPKLAILNVSHNRLGSLGGALREACGLKVLLATDNALRRLDLQQLKRLDQLNTIVASRNRIAEVLGADQLGCLRKLSLSHNELRALGPLPSSLVELRLSHNRLAALPQSLAGCARLMLLDVGSNLLASHDQLAPLRELERLRNLTLHGNPLAAPPAGGAADAGGGAYRVRTKRLLPRLRLLDGLELGIDGGAGANRKVRFSAEDDEEARPEAEPGAEVEAEAEPEAEAEQRPAGANSAPVRKGAARAKPGAAAGTRERGAQAPPARAAAKRESAADRSNGSAQPARKAGPGSKPPATAPAQRGVARRVPSEPAAAAGSAAPAGKGAAAAAAAEAGVDAAAGKKRKRRSRALALGEPAAAAGASGPAGAPGAPADTYAAEREEAPHPKDRALARQRTREAPDEKRRPVEGEVASGIVALEDKRGAVRVATLAELEQLSLPAAGFECW